MQHVSRPGSAPGLGSGKRVVAAAAQHIQAAGNKLWVVVSAARQRAPRPLLLQHLVPARRAGGRLGWRVSK